ncbi:MAG TPA: adenylate/guanylate cyclase domain-containing protein [Actinomycetota bacterium]|jgi:adenylate cyclase|nr:adenylate/guanylate cyclase domain-containing protein [Actinomycetota bacterium]
MSAEEEWKALLSGAHADRSQKSPLRFIPSNPRCKLCRAPFRAPGGLLLRPFGFKPWAKNPKICGRCFSEMDKHAKRCPAPMDGEAVAGAEVELSMLFADVRGSSKIARQMPVSDFTRLMSRFYEVSKDVLFGADAIVEKFVGDEVVALFLPFMTGPDHAGVALQAAEDLLRATGHADPSGPWAPLGAAVHTGTAFVGIVGSRGSSDFTALGDPMNLAAHLASQAAIGEILVTDAALLAAGRPRDGLEHRHLSLKGYPADAVVYQVS